MNGITNLPQFYHDLMRSPFAAAAAAAHLTNTSSSNNNNTSSNNISAITVPGVGVNNSSMSLPSPNKSQSAAANNSFLNHLHQMSTLTQQHQQQQQQNLLLAQHQFQNFIKSSSSPSSAAQQQQAAAAAAASAAAAAHALSYSPYGKASFFSPQTTTNASIEQLKSTFNGLYYPNSLIAAAAAVAAANSPDSFLNLNAQQQQQQQLHHHHHHQQQPSQPPASSSVNSSSSASSSSSSISPQSLSSAFSNPNTNHNNNGNYGTNSSNSNTNDLVPALGASNFSSTSLIYSSSFKKMHSNGNKSLSSSKKSIESSIAAFKQKQIMSAATSMSTPGSYSSNQSNHVNQHSSDNKQPTSNSTGSILSMNRGRGRPRRAPHANESSPKMSQLATSIGSSNMRSMPTSIGHNRTHGNHHQQQHVSQTQQQHSSRATPSPASHTSRTSSNNSRQSRARSDGESIASRSQSGESRPSRSRSRNRETRKRRVNDKEKETDDIVTKKPHGGSVTRTSTPSKNSTPTQQMGSNQSGGCNSGDEENGDGFSSIYGGGIVAADEVEEDEEGIYPSSGKKSKIVKTEDLEDEYDEEKNGLVDELHNDEEDEMVTAEAGADLVEEDEDDDDEDEYELDKEDEELETNTTTSTIKSSRVTGGSQKSINKHGLSANSNVEMNSNSSGGNSNRPMYDFTLQALEMSLYGYLRQTDPFFASHAVSGLKVSPTIASTFNSPFLFANNGSLVPPLTRMKTELGGYDSQSQQQLQQQASPRSILKSGVAPKGNLLTFESCRG
jgi:hypothetical protein